VAKNAISQINTEQDSDRFFLQLGDFLDDFYRAGHDERARMIGVSPKPASKMPSERFSFLAATAHKLANDYSLSVPEWVYDERSYLSSPYFGSHVKGNLRLIYMFMSPTEFKHRNMFVDPEVLTRV
jgi:hypothetical protein